MKETEFFENYIDNFDEKLKGVRLKHKHSYRVVEKAMRISDTLNLDPEDLELVRVSALFHDIARFEQYTKYHTFDDELSFDHGDRGAEILLENGYKNNVVLNVVKYHNKIEIPSYLDNKSKLISRIVRDADKIDIVENQALECKTSNYKIDERLIDCFRKHKSIDKRLKQAIKVEGNIVGMLIMIAFVFDINYRESFIMIRDLDIINKKCDLIKEQGNEGIEEIRKICNKYLESRLKDERVR